MSVETVTRRSTGPSGENSPTSAARTLGDHFREYRLPNFQEPLLYSGETGGDSSMPALDIAVAGEELKPP